MIKKILVLMTVLVVQGCALGPKYTPMTEETRTAVSSIKAYNLVLQDEVRASVDLSTAATKMGGGVLAAAIESSINDDESASSQTIIEPLYNATWDLDYRKLITKQFNPVLIENFNLKNPKESAEAKLLTMKDVKKLVAELKEGEAYLFLNSFYRFQEQFKILQTETVASLFLAGNGTSPAYQNSYFYQSEFVGNGNQSSIKLWAEKDGALFKEKLNESLDQTKDMMLYDMSPLTTENCEGSVQVSSPLPHAAKRKVKGAVLKQLDGQVFVRSKKGTLYKVSSDSVKKIKSPHCKKGKVT